jgi:hypothetical protein
MGPITIMRREIALRLSGASCEASLILPSPFEIPRSRSNGKV